jgi:TonB-linked SusC/RagA family outer membrane protein
MKRVKLIASGTLLLCFHLLFSLDGRAQTARLKGEVKNETDKTGIPNVTVSLTVNRSTASTTTDLKGNFVLNIPASAASGTLHLTITSVGYERKQITIEPDRVSELVTVFLKTSGDVLDNVVVTALGVKKEKKAVAYAVTEVKGSEFTQAREVNIANALSGKVAGVNATSLATGAGGSSRVIIRGNGSLGGDNQPLYVINGMPIDNTTPGGSATTNGGGQNVDRGDGIGGINPDDIESISVLKGGPAAALYGSRASNGVILITTKKGKAQKGIGLEYNTTATIETPVVFSDWQYEYGQGMGGVKPTTQDQAIAWGRHSWGAKMDGEPYIAFDGKMHPYSPQKDNIKNFYETGSTFTNTIAFNGGNEAVNYRLSLSDVKNNSILPNSNFNKKIANLSINAQVGKRISIEAIGQYNFEKANNRPSSGDAPGDPNWSVYMAANTVDVRWLAPGYDSTGREIQWNETPYASNSYFVVNRFKNTDTKSRFIGQASIKFDILKNLYVKGSISRDFFDFKYTGIIPTGTVYTTGSAGEYRGLKSSATESNAMLTANYNTKFLNSIGLNVMVGGNQRKFDKDEINTSGSQYIIPFFYSFTNLTTATTTPVEQHLQTNSLFGSLDMDYKGILYLNASAREDWFSTLSKANNHILYPSVGASLILSEAVNMPSFVNYLKLRSSWAQVGGAVPDPYVLNLTYSMAPSSGQPLQQVTTPNNEYLLNNTNLKPLTSTTIEAGLEAKFLQNRLGIDFTIYNRKTTDDIVKTAISGTSGYQFAYFNVGELSNKGIELLVTGTPVHTKNFSWNTSYNMAYNTNKVEQLAEGINTIQLATSVGAWAQIHNDLNRPYGIIKGFTMVKDAKGQTLYNTSTGYEQRSNLTEVGQGVPPLTMGFSNTFTYKRFMLDVLIDGKFGNDVFSTMNVYAMRFGLDKRTLAGREDGLPLSGVDNSGGAYQRTVPVSGLRGYYDNLKNYTDLFIYDGSFVKLRQVILSYQIPVSTLKMVKLQSATVSFVARNLLILYKQTDNFDPESSYTNSNAQGFEAFGLPRTRSYGLNLTLKL